MSSSAIPAQRSESAWLKRFEPVPAPRVRLVCLPHAGGTAGAYHAWTGDLPADVELVAVQYPGRQERFGEPCVTEMGTLADHITRALLPLADRPLALFGHSMGASVAYEVALRLIFRHQMRPVALFVSGQASPLRRSEGQDLHLRDDEGLLAGLRALGGVEEEVFADPDLRQLVIPSLRSDMRLIRNYRRTQAHRVDIPVTAYVGDADPEVSLGDIQAWRDLTAAEFTARSLPGGHFYLQDRQAELVADIAARLTSVRAR
ncbi:MULTISPECIES: thioesterase II family protein [Streptomyces]|uniref:thioesterase II family protein n=1 Tax=Streptomyces TaxID=1883 RepID=UPI001E595451|nr:MULTISPECIES: alpha/beta fold hydrolase [Streptomyces]UFQ13730.1 alpha/beta fold hydrolase [Streptomyces huasconensis]WCL83325.1 alpha/beta fold hydrolase [Streptomyces sp. JCM 35825]